MVADRRHCRLAAKQKATHAAPAKPEETVEGVRTDVRTIKEHRKP